MQASGTFEISMQGEPPFDSEGAVTLARVTFTKRFSGDLAGTSTVWMLGARTADPAAAGYVALERVRATLGGRTGSFVLQHSGQMEPGATTLVISVVPGSGTDALTGLRGSFEIRIVDGVHHYGFEYTLPDG